MKRSMPRSSWNKETLIWHISSWCARNGRIYNHAIDNMSESRLRKMFLIENGVCGYGQGHQLTYIGTAKLYALDQARLFAYFQRDPKLDDSKPKPKPRTEKAPARKSRPASTEPRKNSKDRPKGVSMYINPDSVRSPEDLKIASREYQSAVQRSQMAAQFRKENEERAKALRLAKAQQTTKPASSKQPANKGASSAGYDPDLAAKLLGSKFQGKVSRFK